MAHVIRTLDGHLDTIAERLKAIPLEAERIASERPQRAPGETPYGPAPATPTHSS